MIYIYICVHVRFYDYSYKDNNDIVGIFALANTWRIIPGIVTGSMILEVGAPSRALGQLP